MLRRAPPTSPVGRRGRRPQQASRLRVLSGWESIFVVSLFVATVFNLYTYSGRRDRFLRAHGNDAGGDPPEPATPNDTLGLAPLSSHRIQHFTTNANDINSKNTKSGGGWVAADTYPSGDPPIGGDPTVGNAKRPQHRSSLHAFAGAVEVNSAAAPTDSDGGDGGSDDLIGVGGGNGDNRPPTSLLPLPAPLGRKRPIQIAARPPAETGSRIGTYDLRWPSGDGGEAGENGEVLLLSSPAADVAHFPCSLTEADDIPGLNGDGGGGAPRKKQLASWSTSGPCVISCSSSPAVTPQGVRVSGGEENEGAREAADRSSAATLLADGAAGTSDGYCKRAVRACELYQECTHILLPPSRGGGGAGELMAGDWGVEAGNEHGIEARRDSGNKGQFATLMHLPVEDGSLAGVQAAAAAAAASGGGWSGSNGGFTLETNKPRTYYVVSFGGSGSKMLGGWLSERGKSMVKEVFHIHDPKPADKLFAKVARRGVSAGREGRGKDFRGYDFPEGNFPSEGKLVEDVDSYRVVMIFKDPAEALVSRYFYNHCKNLRGADCGATPQDFPSLESYAEESGDRLHMETFYDNYCDPATTTAGTAAASGLRRNYPVICINYHKMWDNKEALVKALGLPSEEALKMPKRTETVRNDHTSAERGEPFTLAVRERLRRKHASLSRKVFESPAIAVV